MGKGRYLTGCLPKDQVLRAALRPDQSFLSQADLEARREFVFFTTEALPDVEINWVPYANAHPFVERRDLDLLPAPRIEVARRFEGSTMAKIWMKPGTHAPAEKMLTETQSITVSAEPGHSSTAYTTKKPNDWSVKVVEGQPNPQYNPGEAALIDGVRGDVDWRKGEWFGLQGQDLTVLVTPPVAKRFKHLDIDLSLLHDQRSWITYPKRIEMYLVLENGEEWLAAWSDDETIEDIPAEIMHWHTTYLEKAPQWRRPKIAGIRFVFRNAGLLPDWHLGAGGETFIFLDEITIQE